MTSSPFTAVYDACVLYPAPLRDFLMWLALSGCFRARWSADIHDEWKRNLLRNRADLTAGQLDRTASLMDRAIPDALVTFNQKDFPDEVLSTYGVEAQHPDVFVDNLFDLSTTRDTQAPADGGGSLPRNPAATGHGSDLQGTRSLSGDYLNGPL